MNQDTDWREQQESLPKRTIYILKNNLWSDCKFNVGEGESTKEFNAHKLILSLASPVFEKMFNFNETPTAIAIDDVQPDAFETMLNHAYGVEITIESFDLACDLYYLAEKYMMTNLSVQCDAYLMKTADASNACRGYEFAKLFHHRSLLAKSKEIISNQTSDVISHNSFLEVQLSTLQMILDENRLNLKSEMELFAATVKWTQNEFKRQDIAGAEFAEKQKSIYDQLIPKICFLAMNPKEFAAGPALSQLLTQEQSFAILMNLTSGGCTIPLPEGLTSRVRTVVPNDGSEKIIALPLLDDKLHLSGQWEWTTEFSCNEDITLLGVTVKSQSDLSLYGPTYQEDMTIVCDTGTGEPHRAHFSPTVSCNSSFDVYLPTPLKLLADTTCKIDVALNVCGRYESAGFYSSDVSEGTTKFEFNDIVSTTSIIQQLIYTQR